MRNADGQTHKLTDLLTTERMRAAREAGSHSRDLAAACKQMGDQRNYIRARLDFASARRVESGLRKGAAA